MAAEAGRSFLLKLGTGTSVTTVAGQTETGFKIAGEAVDITTKDDAGKRKLGAAFGKSSLQVTASGKGTGTAHFTTLAGYAEDRSINDMTLVYDDGSVITASFQLTEFEFSGAEGGDDTWKMTLESSGDWSNA